MLGYVTRAFGSLPLNTPFVYQGHDALKVSHPVFGFAVKFGDGRMAVLTSKTTVHVAERPKCVMDAVKTVNELANVRRMLGRRVLG